MLVNGEPLLSLLNPQGMKGEVKQGQAVYHTPKGMVMSGLTHHDVFVLPASARVSVSYNGDSKCEGFLSM